MKQEIKTTKAPQAVGPYSQAIKVGNFIYCAGNIGKDLHTNRLVSGGIREETKKTLENLNEVLKAAGATLKDVVKTTVYLQNMADYPSMNEVYAAFFRKPYPARATVEVVKLPIGALVEIECIAYAEGGCCGGKCDCGSNCK
ncbi:Rid family detoxifying hydrolase [Candidatus Microgenomates bacterium]|nr:Rid family detoxifying hydrolase [Candidatus Microgenomates bacterium]